jgi:predicted GNAT superfamily acetyltransferase
VIEFRSCEGFDELAACVQLQVETWRIDASEVTPRKTFVLAQKIGGQVLGAFDKTLAGGPESLVGFLMALPGVKSRNGQSEPYLHSHMLAVREGYRNRGLGAELKRQQRLEALRRGIRWIEWTFDPLEIKNAYLNIHKLGAVVRAYAANFYGVSSSRLQGGLPTDRLIAEWRLDSRRARAATEGAQMASYKIDDRIVVPSAIYQWKATEVGRELAMAVQSKNRDRFQGAFSQGLAVLDFARDAEGNGIFELGQASQLEPDSYYKDSVNL